MQSLSCTCVLFLSGCCKVYRCAGVLLNGLLHNVFWTTAKFLDVCACFPGLLQSFSDTFYRCAGVLLNGLLHSVFLNYCKVP